MGKQGPCYHCGVTSTPLWRNGPPEKPVLCNACGSRWRTKGTLSNYIPLHARAEGDEHEDLRVSPVKTISLKKRDEKLNKRKLSYESTVVGRYASSYNQGLQRSIDEDTSNRSSSGSAVSNSESCAQFSADASDLTGPAQSTVWETQVPSKKRTCISRTTPSSVEKLTQDLRAILHEQQSSNLSGSSEELLFESDTPMVSVEIGHGSVLIKHPSSLLREEESEASSLSVENKLFAFNEAYSHSAPLFECMDFKGESVCYHGNENHKIHKSQMMQQQQTKRDMPVHDRMQLLWNHNSPLCHIDLNDVINFEVLLEHLTSDEQRQLLKHLPSSDTTQLPGSLSSMFDSSLFKENLSSFQQLLSEGVFSSSSLGIEAEDIKSLKKFAVTNLAKSKWLELYNKLKSSKFVHNAGEHQVASGDKLGQLENLGNAKRSLVELNQNLTGPRTTIKIPKKVLMKAGPVAKEMANSNNLSFSPRSQFALPTEDQCLMLDSHQFVDVCTDQDLLLDVPSNGFFPQAELLPISSFIHSYQMSAKSSSINPP